MNRTGIALLAATMVLGLALCASAAPQTITMNISKGWNMLALPAAPLNPAPSPDWNGGDDETAVFTALYHTEGDSLDSNNLVRWDPIARSNRSYASYDVGSFGNCLVGDGYWVRKDTNGTVANTYQGVDVSGDHWISLPRKGWTLIGYPNMTPASLEWRCLQVTNGIQTVDIQTAVDSGMVAQYAYHWNNAARSLRSVGPDDGISDTLILESGQGYWFQSLQDNLALIVPGAACP